MLSGATFRACETAGTAVFRIVVSVDSMKKATATSQGNSLRLDSDGTAAVPMGFVVFIDAGQNSLQHR
jgi:hypothetical protein